MYAQLTDYEEYLANQVVDIAVKIHKTLGPGLLESVYEKCFFYELSRRNIYCERQKMIPIVFESLKVEEGLRLDLLVENLLIVELKAQENSHPIWTAQLLSYLRLANKRIGFIINFHVTLMKDGIKRIVL
jgi:GxxExxY protein